MIFTIYWCKRKWQCRTFFVHCECVNSISSKFHASFIWYDHVTQCSMDMQISNRNRSQGIVNAFFFLAHSVLILSCSVLIFFHEELLVYNGMNSNFFPKHQVFCGNGDLKCSRSSVSSIGQPDIWFCMFFEDIKKSKQQRRNN